MIQGVADSGFSYSKTKEVRIMKTKLLSLALAVLWTPTLAPAAIPITPPIPGAACSAVQQVRPDLITLANAFLASLGLGPICY
jgi:hypothetical protein